MTFEPRVPRDDVNVSSTHPLSEAAFLLAAIVLVMAGLVVLSGLVVEAAARWLPVGIEARWLGALAAVSDTDDSREPALDALLQRLAAHWPDAPYRFQVHVTQADDPNALALPGGAIVVTSALLERTQSENELAFVLAHELGHFRHRDHLRALGRRLLVGLVSAAASSLGNDGATLPWTVGELMTLRFDRAQESAADRFALEIVAAEYGHVNGATRFFERLPDAAGSNSERASAWLASHPVTADRIDAMHEETARRGLATQGALTPLPAWAAER
jgi:Zn-dependent protease with chaperone function